MHGGQTYESEITKLFPLLHSQAGIPGPGWNYTFHVTPYICVYLYLISQGFNMCYVCPPDLMIAPFLFEPRLLNLLRGPAENWQLSLLLRYNENESQLKIVNFPGAKFQEKERSEFSLATFFISGVNSCVWFK